MLEMRGVGCKTKSDIKKYRPRKERKRYLYVYTFQIVYMSMFGTLLQNRNIK